MDDAARRWAGRQNGRGIPPGILAAAPADPWTHDPRDFAAPAVAAATPSRGAVAELLHDGGGVLDVGCGGGAAAFALDRVTAVVGVDRQQDMLDRFAATAAERDIPCRTVLGTWPAAVTRWERTTPARQDPAFVARRLCLPPARSAEVVAAPAALPPRPRQVATLVWRS